MLAVTWNPPLRMIYFPMKGQREVMPYVIYVVHRVSDPLGVAEYRGVTELKELEDGRYAFYRESRCRPFSDELLKSCEDWNERRLQVAKDYETLLKKGFLK